MCKRDNLSIKYQTMKNNTFKEIADVLKDAKTVLLYPHVGIDGDAVGSCVAICKTLRNMGKTCYALYNEDLPMNLQFMTRDYFTNDKDIIDDSNLDVSMAIDCGGYDRFVDFKDKFNKAKVTICVDHHGTSTGIADYNYIDKDASAAGVLVFDLLKEMGIESDKEIGEALFAAITTDTGNFQYSNTSKRCHEIMAELYDWGIDVNRVSVEIYENERPEKLKIANVAMDNLEMIANGQGVVAYVSYDDLKRLGVLAGETDPIVQTLRSIRGVEIAAFLKEKEPNVIRVSYRAKLNANVSDLAVLHNGGGHVKAAGCTLYTSLEEAIEIIKRDIEDALR